MNNNNSLPLSILNNPSINKEYDNITITDDYENNQLQNSKFNRLIHTTFGKIILGSVIILGVGVIGCAITAAVILSNRNIITANNDTTTSTSNTFTQQQKCSLVTTKTILPNTANSSIAQLTTQATTQLTLKPTTNLCEPYRFSADFISSVANNLTSQVNKQSLQNYLTNLLALGIRDNQYNSSSNSFVVASKHIKAKIKELKSRTFRQRFAYGNSTIDYREIGLFSHAQATSRKEKSCNPINNASCNLYSLIPGRTNNVIVVGAHLDTVVSSPGANDNGSSVVALVEIIRILKSANLQLNNSILFCFWGSKERPTSGSKAIIGFGSGFFLHNNAYQDIMKKLIRNDPCPKQIKKFNIQCYLNLELIGTKNRKHSQDINIDDPAHDKFPKYYEKPPAGTKKLTELYAEFLTQKNINFFRAKPNPNVTDVLSFYAKGIPSLTITAGKDKAPSCYHQSCDNITGIDFNLMSNITQTVLYSLVHLSLGDGLSNI